MIRGSLVLCPRSVVRTWSLVVSGPWYLDLLRAVTRTQTNQGPTDDGRPRTMDDQGRWTTKAVQKDGRSTKAKGLGTNCYTEEKTALALEVDMVSWQNG